MYDDYPASDRFRGSSYIGMLPSHNQDNDRAKRLYQDSLLMHSPMKTLEDTLTVWRVFEEAHDAGSVRQR